MVGGALGCGLGLLLGDVVGRSVGVLLLLSARLHRKLVLFESNF